MNKRFTLFFVIAMETTVGIESCDSTPITAVSEIESNETESEREGTEEQEDVI